MAHGVQYVGMGPQRLTITWLAWYVPMLDFLFMVLKFQEVFGKMEIIFLPFTMCNVLVMSLIFLSVNMTQLDIVPDIIRVKFLLFVSKKELMRCQLIVLMVTLDCMEVLNIMKGHFKCAVTVSGELCAALTIGTIKTPM
jgi:hypothetical protein